MLLPPKFTTLRSVVAISTQPWVIDASHGEQIGLYVTSTFKSHIRVQNYDPNLHASFNWNEASLSAQHLRSFLNTHGKNNWVGILKRYMKNIPEFLDSRVGKSRSLSFGISNLGSVDVETHTPNGGIQRTIFSQTISALDSAIQVNVIAAKFLNIGISWQEGIVAERLILSLIDIMETFLDNGAGVL